MPIQDTLSARLKLRLGQLDPRGLEPVPVSLRAEIVTGADALGARLVWWRTLVAAAEPANPALEPESVLAVIRDDNPAPLREFLFIWREGEAGSGVRERELIAFIPFTAARLGPLRLPWVHSWAPGWWPVATPLVHRRHQVAAARSFCGWLAGRPAIGGGIVLRDLVEAGEFAAELASSKRSRRSVRRMQPALTSLAGSAVGDDQSSGELVIRSGATLSRSALEASLALLALWAGGIGLDGTLGHEALNKAHYNHLLAVASQGRITICEAARGGHITAMAVALRSGSSASIIAAAASNRLSPGDGEAELGRALSGLVTCLSHGGRVVALDGPVGALPVVTQHLPQQRPLSDLVLAAPGFAGATLLAVDYLRVRFRKRRACRIALDR